MLNRRTFVELVASASAGFAVARGRADVAGKTAITLLNPDCTGGGAGLCAVLRTPSGKTYLFDTANGESAARSNGTSIVIPWLKAHGVREIEGLVISHYHADHFGGFLSMWDAFPVKKVFNNNFLPQDAAGVPKHNGESRIARAALDAFAAAHPGALVENVREGTSLGWDEPGFSAELVWPPSGGYVGEIKDRPGYGKNDTIYHHLLNGNANALRVVAGGKVFFLMGDIQPDYAARYMRPLLESRGKWGCDVCVLPAHGTSTGEAMALIQTMKPLPKVVVVSLGNLPWMQGCGRSNVKNYGRLGMRAYSTNIHGDITLVFDGGEPAVTTDPSKIYPLTAGGRVHPDTSAEGWRSLLGDGPLEEVADFQPGTWRREGKDGLTATVDSALWFKGTYENFVLDFEYRLDPEANSGVIIYCSDVKDWIPNSVEVQLLDDFGAKWRNDPPRLKNGGLYGHVGPAASAAKPAGEWNRMTVWAEGKRVRVAVNGAPSVDVDLSRYTSAKTNPDGTPIPPWLSKPLAELPTKGAIGLQGKHGGACPHFRNVRIFTRGN